MVCVPCFIVPVLLFLWHKFIQPYVLRFWNPWAVKDADGNVKTEFPISCEGGVCAFRRNKPDAANAEAKKQCINTEQSTQEQRLKAE